MNVATAYSVDDIPMASEREYIVNHNSRVIENSNKTVTFPLHRDRSHEDWVKDQIYRAHLKVGANRKYIFHNFVVKFLALNIEDDMFGKDTQDDDIKPSDKDKKDVNRNQNLPQDDHRFTVPTDKDPNLLQVSDDGSMSYWSNLYIGSQ